MELMITLHEDAKVTKNDKKEIYKLDIKDDYMLPPRITFHAEKDDIVLTSTYFDMKSFEQLENKINNYEENLKFSIDRVTFLEKMILEKNKEIQNLRSKLDFYQSNTEYLYD